MTSVLLWQLAVLAFWFVAASITWAVVVLAATTARDLYQRRRPLFGWEVWRVLSAGSYVRATIAITRWGARRRALHLEQLTGRPHVYSRATPNNRPMFQP